MVIPSPNNMARSVSSFISMFSGTYGRCFVGLTALGLSSGLMNGILVTGQGSYRARRRDVSTRATRLQVCVLFDYYLSTMCAKMEHSFVKVVVPASGGWRRKRVWGPVNFDAGAAEAMRSTPPARAIYWKSTCCRYCVFAPCVVGTVCGVAIVSPTKSAARTGCARCRRRKPGSVSVSITDCSAAVLRTLRRNPLRSALRPAMRPAILS